MNTNVRKATLADLPTLVDFTSKEAEEAEGVAQDLTRLETGVKAALEDHSLATYWILTDEANAPVGSVSALKEWSDWNAGFYWWIQSLYIVPEQRGKGHLKTLLNTVEAEMRSQKGLELRLYVHQDNKRAIRAYEKTGFEASPSKIMTRKVSPPA